MTWTLPLLTPSHSRLAWLQYVHLTCSSMATFSDGAGSEPGEIQGVLVPIQEGKEVTESQDVAYIWVYLLLPQAPPHGKPKALASRRQVLLPPWD